MTHQLFVVRDARGDGFRATVHGHILELADPDSGHALAPTPEDLLIASVASALAWSARGLLRTRRLPDDVSVSATWRSHGDPARLAGIDATVTVPNGAAAVSATLGAVLQNSFAALSLSAPLRVHIQHDHIPADERVAA